MPTIKNNSSRDWCVSYSRTASHEPAIMSLWGKHHIHCRSGGIITVKSGASLTFNSIEDGYLWFIDSDGMCPKGFHVQGITHIDSGGNSGAVYMNNPYDGDAFIDKNTWVEHLPHGHNNAPYRNQQDL